MAEILKKKNVKPDLILSSTATRALEFARIIADKLDYKKKNITSCKDLYLAGENEMLKIIQNINDANETVFMVGHNPDITNLANSLCDYKLDNIPTSGIFCVEFDLDSWKNVNYSKGIFASFDFPKKYLI